jgi:adenylosuccinate lyase
MPQKRNPIRSERVTGMSRLVRSNCFAVIESCAGLWEERDLSHSSVERVALVDALHALAFCLTEMTRVVRDLEVLPIELTSRGIEVPTGVGALEVLMDDGMSYTDAYRLVRERGLVDALNSRDKPNWRLAAEFNQSRFGGIGRGAVSVTGANLWGGVKERIGIDQ